MNNWMDIYEKRNYGSMPYRLLRPIDIADHPETAYPLIFSLHGAGGKGTDNIKNLRHWNQTHWPKNTPPQISLLCARPTNAPALAHAQYHARDHTGIYRLALRHLANARQATAGSRRRSLSRRPG